MKTSEANELARTLRVIVQRLRREADALESVASWIEHSVKGAPAGREIDPDEEVKDLGSAEDVWDIYKP
jgi:hypothetical protein